MSTDKAAEIRLLQNDRLIIVTVLVTNRLVGNHYGMGINLKYADSFLFIVPEDVAMGFTTIYGFAPRIFKGNDHRIGFGFRFGEHADLQILYEFGPQTSTTALKERILPSPSRRSQPRRPFLELLVRAGLLNSYRFNVVHEKIENQQMKCKENKTNIMLDVLQELD